MGSFRKSVPALAGLLFGGILILGGAAPAGAAPPFPVGAQATALVGGGPLIQASCPTAAGDVDGGSSTAGSVSVGSPAGGLCTGSAATANGEYAIATVTAPLPNSLRFSAICESTGGSTSGGVDVPAGTNVTGIGVVAVQTLVTGAGTAVTYPGGTTAILNQVTTTPSSVTRSAIVITGGVGAGTVVGRVICGPPFVYPLAVDVASGGGATTPALAVTSPLSTGTDPSRSPLLLAAGAFALLVLAQVAIGRNMLRRRRLGDSN